MDRKIVVVIAQFVAFVAACNGGQSGHEGERDLDSAPDAASLDGAAPGSNRIVYDEIKGGGSSMAWESFCDLVRNPRFEAAGLYRVKSLTGVAEVVSQDPGILPYTYVELELIEGWHNAEGDAVARIFGGPFPDGTTAVWRVSLKVNEVLGLLLVDRSPENLGYYDLHPLGIFRKGESGGYTNGDLFSTRVVDAAELGALVSATAATDASEPCPYDESADDTNQDAGLDSSE